MTASATQIKSEGASPFHPSLFQEQLNRLSHSTLDQFKAITRHYALFHLCFFSLALFEIVLFLFFFSFFAKSAWMAFCLAGFFLTGFSYFVLLFYFQAKKPQQMLLLRNEYREECLKASSFSVGAAEYHLSATHALYRLVDALESQEHNYYPLLMRVEALAPLIEKFTIWAHWKDVHAMKELLLFAALDQQMQLVKLSPTDLEAHASLANGCVALSRLYMDPRKRDPRKQPVWVSREYSSPEMQHKFRMAAERAIEEFTILDAYAPRDPWVHAQLASLCHDLALPEKEIAEYETLLDISPDNQEVLLRLGILYFQQGHNAKGLKIYDQLKKEEPTKAEELISYYDIYLRDELLK